MFDECGDGDGGVYKLYCRKQVGLKMRWLKSGCEELGRCDVILERPCAVSVAPEAVG